MRRVVRDGIALGLLWLAHGKTSWAAQSSGDNNITSTNNDIDSSHDYMISLITMTPTASGVEAQLPRTCRSGTVNYITHSSPQQCPTFAWSTSAQYSLPGQNTSASGSAGSGESDTTRSTTSTSEVGPSSTPTTSTSGVGLSSTPTNPTTVQNTAASASESTTPASTSRESVTELAASSVTIQAASTDAEEELETDSPLDNANFLSFDDWKKQNLEKAGQSPDGGQPANTQVRARPDMSLDALGDEGEISLDFAGFGTGSTSTGIDKAKDNKKPTTNSGNNPSPNGPVLRSKDAGKTCKERSNYASFDCAATILKTNKEAKSANAILIEHKDSYMLNLCSAPNKFTIVELCDDILIDTIVLANYEFFSSIFRTFRVSVSDRYPVKLDRWKVLGIFEATNSRSVQAFLVEQPLIWARYLRIEWLTHFGNEYYCPVSLLRVHGTTMMEEYRHEEVVKRGEHLDDSDAEEEDGVEQPGEESPVVETIAQQPESVSIVADKSVVESLSATSVPVDTTPNSPQDSASTIPSSEVTSSVVTSANPSFGQAVSSQTYTNGTVRSTGHSVSTSSDQAANTTSIVPTTSPAMTNQQTPPGKTTLLDKASSILSGASEMLIGEPTSDSTMSSSDSKRDAGISSDGASGITAVTQNSSSKNASEISTGSVTSSGSRVHWASSISAPTDNTNSSEPVPQASNSAFRSSPSAVSSMSTNASASQQSSQSSTPSLSLPLSAPPSSSSSSQSFSVPSAPSSSHQSQQKQQQQQRAPTSGATSSYQPSPTTQESFFKSFSKRLQLLESNTTLSLQYIESQSLLLRNAFQAVEKRQVHKTTNFLSTLNATVTAELENFRKEQERLWEGVVIEMEVQRRMQEREVLMLGQRLGVLAEEVVWQKRVGVVQTTLLLLCLGLIIFTRSGTGGMVGLEMPLLQQLQLRRNKWGSQSGGRGWEGDGPSPPQSPNPVTDNEDLLSPTSGTDGGHEKGGWGATRRRRGFWRNKDDALNARNTSESTEGRPDTRDGTPSQVNNPDLRFQSATPTSPRSQVDAGSEVDDFDDEEAGLDEEQMQDLDGPLEDVEEEILDSQDAVEEGYIPEGQEDEEPEHVMPRETQSSPSTPSGTRDQLALSGVVEGIPAWPTDGVVDGMIQM